MLSDLKAILDIQRIKARGGSAKVSVAQITKMVINLHDARANLTEMEFHDIHEAYLTFQKLNTKWKIDFDTYLVTAQKIVLAFNKIAPYEKYSGSDPEETQRFIQEISEK